MDPVPAWFAAKPTGFCDCQSRAGYHDNLPPPSSWLIIFDRRPQAKELPWEDRPGRAQEGSVTALRM
jgi:hypothetical protein